MPYLINDIFYTLQGEGFWTGRAAVFIRFSRCNLWTGRESDRASAVCNFCDTDFTNATRFSLQELLDSVGEFLSPSCDEPMAVLTGGEPLLQVDADLIEGLHKLGFYVAVETNGTQHIPPGIDWVCVSPKPAPVVASRANELKLVYPQPDVTPEQFDGFDCDWFWLSPMDGEHLTENLSSAIDYCLSNPKWRLNVQTHKVIGVP